jgi:hypothetical protein
MSRALVSVLILVSSIALAQETPPPSPPSGDAPTPPPVAPAVTEPAPAPAAATDTGPKASDQAKKRFSRLSAGNGGPLFAFAEGLDGLVLGALAGGGLQAGGQIGTGGAFIGALIGGAVLGGGATLLQYFHPIGLASAGTISLGIGVGALAGFGIASAAVISSFTPAVLLALGMSQVGMLVPLIALWDVDDISGEDLGLMGMTAAYAFVLTGLTTLLFNTLTVSARTAAVLFAPAFGMGLGALWAWGQDLAPGRILKLTALPLGVGLLTFTLGVFLTGFNMQLTGAATLVTTAATFALTYFLTADSPPATNTTSAVSITPTVSMAPAGWRNEAMAVGPALVGRF